MEIGVPLVAQGFFAEIIVHPLTISSIIGLLFLGFLLIFSALVSGSESAYFSLSSTEIARIRKAKTGSSGYAIKLLSEPNMLLSTVLIANNMINVGIVVLSTFLTSEIFDFSAAPVLGYFIQVVLITFLILLFGEILPKVYATHRPVPMVHFMSRPLFVVQQIVKPLGHLLIFMAKRVNRHFSLRKKNISLNDLSDAIDITVTKNPEDRKILKGIVKLVNIEARDIMTPRMDVVALDYTASFKEVLDVVMESGLSRIPVFSESFDNVKGILYVKDILSHIQKDEKFRWQFLIRKPYFVPEHKKSNDLLEEFQTRKNHMAIVVDEFGGTCGIVTLEDILEEIVGEISDESDQEEILFHQIDDVTYMFEGKILLNDFCKVFNENVETLDEVRGEADTLAGLILEMKGEMPRKNDTLTFRHFEFLIDMVDSRRIKKIRVVVKPKQSRNDQNEEVAD
ncbi:gliding motility-associated protein GldE [Williamwhitmania taraxaci]|uniref:Gliding motility-associated protein GldE n=1 Tax=Williamwhitmania taraxaci TaxID=1640674 RepID=A0A1G6HF71_9BACT|nr:gliding motility-associated protein GldE [Williamwhitmania taraxaci]SDB92096.1 gliding motility-associated protein GldE [Williamwhitmania taraxaci]